MTVFPFILRGVRLAGIDSAMAPGEVRQQIWQRLAGDLKPAQLGEGVKALKLEQHYDVLLQARARDSRRVA